jgi:hypothetical protein
MLIIMSYLVHNATKRPEVPFGSTGAIVKIIKNIFADIYDRVWIKNI